MADKIAIFGGSFNPIHSGHIEVALRAKKECGLKKVIFLPNAVPPHKESNLLAGAHHRYNMVKLAIKPYSDFEVSDYEINRTEPSYTIDTMRYMKTKYSEDLYFIIGADSLYTLHKWKSYESLIAECSFIVADRNCTEGNDVLEKANKINSVGGNITVLSMPKFDVTSTFIRENINSGTDVSGFVPESVEQYIKDNNLYKSNSEEQK